MSAGAILDDAGRRREERLLDRSTESEREKRSGQSCGSWQWAVQVASVLRWTPF